MEIHYNLIIMKILAFLILFTMICSCTKKEAVKPEIKPRRPVVAPDRIIDIKRVIPIHR